MDQWHLTRIVKKTAKRAGIKNKGHSLRKTFRAVCARRPHDLETLEKLDPDEVLLE